MSVSVSRDTLILVSVMEFQRGMSKAQGVITCLVVYTLTARNDALGNPDEEFSLVSDLETKRH